MVKGGYQIIDLKNKELQLGVGMVYDGIYDLLESTRKVVLVSGLNIDGTEYKDMFLNFGVVGSEFHAIIIFDITNTLLITINDNDIVTITQQID